MLKVFLFILQATQASKDSRASVLQAKRLRRGGFAQHSLVADAEASAASPGKATVPSLVDAVYKAAGNPGVRLGAVRSLRRLLSTGLSSEHFLRSKRAHAGPCQGEMHPCFTFLLPSCRQSSSSSPAASWSGTVLVQGSTAAVRCQATCKFL